MAGHGHPGGDDPDRDAADDRQERPVGKAPQDGRAAARAKPGPGTAPSSRGPRRESPRSRSRGRRAASWRPAGAAAAEDRADQHPGAGLDRGHQHQGGIVGLPVLRFLLAEPPAVRGGVGDPDGLAAVEGHRPVIAVHDPRSARPQRPGQDLEQPLHRPGPRPGTAAAGPLLRPAHGRLNALCTSLLASASSRARWTATPPPASRSSSSIRKASPSSSSTSRIRSCCVPAAISTCQRRGTAADRLDRPVEPP